METYSRVRPGIELTTLYEDKRIGKVISKEQTPTPEFSPRVDMFISPVGVFSRKNLAMIKEIYLGKIFYFLNEKVKEMVDDKNVSDDKIIKLILDIYGILLPDDIFKKVKLNIKSIGEVNLRNKIRSGEITLFFTLVPFHDIEFETLKTAADHLNIPLDEKIYIPELDQWTKEPVPVGITYAQALEQTSEIYASVRSAGKYQGITGQATKGKSREGGQSIGNLDVYALLTYDCPSFLQEILTLRSDDHISKRKVVNNIIATGSSELPKKTGGGGTTNLMKIFMLGLGLSFDE